MCTPSIGSMRASDGDREAVVAVLCDSYAAGRLSLRELRERAGAAFSARTCSDLHQLVIDLPRGPVSRPRPGGAGPRPAGKRWGQPTRCKAPVLLTVLAVLALAAAVFVPAEIPLVALTLIIMSMSALFAAGLAATLLVSAAEMTAARGGRQGRHRPSAGLLTGAGLRRRRPR